MHLELTPLSRVLRKNILQRPAAQREILLHLVARHEKRRAHRVEAAIARVRRQIAHIHLHAQQIADRVLILAAIQPPHDDLPA